MIFHTLVVDVNSGTCSSRSMVEIPQGDKNSHQLMIKLVNRDKFYSIEEGTTPEITFYDSFDHELFTTLSVKVANNYRGYVTYVVGPRLTRDFGRYVARLDLYDRHHDRKVSARFVINVTKGLGCGPGGPGGCPGDDCSEVVVTREFYKDLLAHLRDDTRHLTYEDRDLLDFVAHNKSTFITFDNLSVAISEDPEVRAVLQATSSEIVRELIEGDFARLEERVEVIEETLDWKAL